MTEALSKKIRQLPQRPGVYLFKNEHGSVIYVGKAVKLKNRVSSYFKNGAGADSPRIRAMIGRIRDLDYAVTDNELESLVLENNFIKQLKPRYNVRMRDDKNYLFIRINLQDQIPTIGYERKVTERRARYFGPYTNGAAAKDTLRMIRRIFPYCALSQVGNKPCFYYHIQKCPGVCFGKISPEDYRKDYIEKIIGFLEGRQSAILKELQGEMKFLARHGQFEKAARTRDQIFALNRMLERQKLVYPKKVSQDVFSLHPEPSAAAVNLFRIREGKLIEKENFLIENTRQATEPEILEEFLQEYYLDASSVPAEMVLPAAPASESLDLLLASKRAGRAPKISVPSRGTKLNLLKLGRENAKQYLESQSDKAMLEEARLMSALKELQRVLDLPALPGRIECFDISNIQGTNAVGSMVVFGHARPKKDGYRRFKINRKNTPDDYAMMREMLERRLRRSERADDRPRWPLPDLIVVDGGRGQLNAALSVLNERQLSIPAIGLAKRLEEIYHPARPQPLTLPPNSIALFLLQRIRDEAHRFAVGYHRKLRSRSALSSALDGIPGIGPAKKKALLGKFGSASGLRQASLTDIAAVVGSRLAEKIKASL